MSSECKEREILRKDKNINARNPKHYSKNKECRYGLISGFTTAEEIINELEDLLIKTSQIETQREKE